MQEVTWEGAETEERMRRTEDQGKPAAAMRGSRPKASYFPTHSNRHPQPTLLGEVPPSVGKYFINDNDVYYLLTGK